MTSKYGRNAQKYGKNVEKYSILIPVNVSLLTKVARLVASSAFSFSSAHLGQKIPQRDFFRLPNQMIQRLIYLQID